ncbi:molybdopterin-binding protein [Rhodobacteraceae bacterium]|nr:molybdopterin-binding protein [Paracoccaceae bacterium]
MKFGPVPVGAAIGNILAHSISGPDGTIRKGTVLTAEHTTRLHAAGTETVIVAQLEAEDIPENEAATRIGARIGAPGFRVTDAFTGRVNLVADRPGIVRINADSVQRMNAVDEGLTLATLPDLMRVNTGQLVATVKVIPYGVAERQVDAAVEALDDGTVQFFPFKSGKAQLILTKTPGFKESLLTKGKQVVAERVTALGMTLSKVVVVDHAQGAIAGALDPAMDLIMILGASATSDRHDVAPAAVVARGGTIDRFGMPVDPGNLLFLGRLDSTPIVGLPGCARSPAMNGVDWVLERLASGIPVDADNIAGMGVGGLLKEMPGRPQPRQPKT